MIKVLIADDHPVIRAGIKAIIEGESGIQVLGEAASGTEVIQLISQENYDIILMDISMPGRSGLETLKQLKSINPALQVLMLSRHSEEQYAIRSLKAGAAGYLTKNSAPEELVAAIRKISDGGRYVSAGLAEKLALDLERKTNGHLHDNLSDREFEVMCLIASGKSVTEISQELSLSVNTISTYRARIMEKMGFNINTELTRYALDNKLID